MSNKRYKAKKTSIVELTRKYASDPMACVAFFKDAKWPTGFYCEKCGCTHYHYLKRHNVFECKKCGHQHYLLAGTIFQDNKLELYKLILGLFLFFSENKGCTATKLTSDLDINPKTATRLCHKFRILMAESNSEKILDSLFYESDVAYIGAKSKEKNKTGMATEKQPFLAILSTDKENKYPKYIKLHLIPKDNKEYLENFISKSIKLSKDRKLNTDGKTTFSPLSKKIALESEKIIYTEESHRLYWLNIIIGNIQNNISGIYHGIAKRSMPLFLNEQEWRFNHRNVGLELMNKIRNYITLSYPVTESMIKHILDISKPHFSLPVSEG